MRGFFFLITSQDLSANISVKSNEVRARMPNLIKKKGLFSADRINIPNASCSTEILLNYHDESVRSTAV